MDADQQNKCIGLLLAIAFDGKTEKEVIQKKVKAFLAELPAEEVALAAATPMQL